MAIHHPLFCKSGAARQALSTALLTMSVKVFPENTTGFHTPSCIFLIHLPKFSSLLKI